MNHAPKAAGLSDHVINAQLSPEQSEMREIGARLREARGEAGIPIEEAARALGLRHAALKRIEEGRLPGVLKFREMLTLYGAAPHRVLLGGGVLSLTEDQLDEMRMLAAAASPGLQTKILLLAGLCATGS